MISEETAGLTGIDSKDEDPCVQCAFLGADILFRQKDHAAVRISGKHVMVEKAFAGGRGKGRKPSDFC